MRTTGLSKLFEPTVIRGIRIPNRIAMCAMNDNLAFPDGYATQHEIDYYAARAAGGIGLMVTGNAYIDEEASKISGTQIGCHDDRMIPGLSRLVESVHAYGTRIVLQLAHAGPQTLPETIRFQQTVAPSAQLFVDPSRELSIPEIERIISSFVAAAYRAKRAGFDGIEIHAGHGYLLSAFLSPRTNRRTDRYGGPLENRLRIVLEILERTRTAIGDAPIIGAKFNSSDLVQGGLTFEDGIEVARALAGSGVDYLGVSRGVGDSVDEMIAPLYYERHKNIAAARRVKDAVSVPVIAMGAILDPTDANEILKRGDADLVAIGRALIADPDWAVKARQARASEIRPCIRCNECVALVDENREVRCAVNPLVGREAQVIDRPSQPKRILVLGGGPAGCEAARVAAERGHRVVLVERRERLGGASVPRGNPAFKRELNRLPAWYEGQLHRLGVEIRLNTVATIDLVEGLDPDVVIYAIGGEPVIPDIPGVETGHVITATDLLESQAEVPDDVVVLGAGFVGCETAVHLARQGKRVQLVTRRPASQIAADLNYTMKLALLKELQHAGVTVLDTREIDRIEEDAVVARSTAGNGAQPQPPERIRASSVVLARGFRPRGSLANQLIALGYDVRLIGESVQTGLIFDAVHQGFAVGRTV